MGQEAPLALHPPPAPNFPFPLPPHHCRPCPLSWDSGDSGIRGWSRLSPSQDPWVRDRGRPQHFWGRGGHVCRLLPLLLLFSLRRGGGSPRAPRRHGSPPSLCPPLPFLLSILSLLPLLRRAQGKAQLSSYGLFNLNQHRSHDSGKHSRRHGRVVRVPLHSACFWRRRGGE